MTVNRQIATGRVSLLVARSGARLALEARGEVLHLGRVGPPRYGPGVTRVRHLDEGCELAAVGAVDTVLSVCELWRSTWTEDRLCRLADVLGAGGRLLFVEPVAVTGASGALQRLIGPVARRSGVGFDRVVPDVLRSAGLVPVDLQRVCADRRGRVRTFVVGTAVRR